MKSGTMVAGGAMASLLHSRMAIAQLPKPQLLRETHFVDVGGQRLNATSTCDNVLAFRNPDGEIVVLVRNELTHPQLVQVQLSGRAMVLELPPDSLGTLSVGQPVV